MTASKSKHLLFGVLLIFFFSPAQPFWTVSPVFVVKSLHNALSQKASDFMPTTVFNYVCIGNRWHVSALCFNALTSFVLFVCSLKASHLLTMKSRQTDKQTNKGALFSLSLQFIFKVRTLGSLSLAWVGEGSGVSFGHVGAKAP